MENNTCKDCKWFSSALFVCWHEANEGIRAFEHSKACKYFNKLEKLNKNDN